MKKLLITLVLPMLMASSCFGQDVRVNVITSPNSGCGLTAAETITLEIENVGLTDLSAVPFTLAYAINAGIPVVEAVVFPVFTPNTTLSYTFVANADLSIPGLYLIDGACSLIGDLNTSNDAVLGYSVMNDGPSVGGVVSISIAVCSSGNAGGLTLAGETGAIQRWESSVDGGSTWLSIANTTTFQSYLNLAVTTMYRAVVQNGSCPEAFSVASTITVDQSPVGGNVTPSVEVCEAYNSGTLILTDELGTIMDWESSADLGATWTSLGASANSIGFTNLATTTWYRAIVGNGVCASVFSTIGVITVHPKPGPIFVVPDACIGAESNFADGTTLSSGVVSFYLWEFGDGGSSVAVNPAHTYDNPGSYSARLITITDKGCADTVFNNAIVNSLPDSRISANGPLSYCGSGSVDLNGEPGLMYAWSTAETSETITATISGTYILNVTDSVTFCTDVDSVALVISAVPIANAGNDITVSLGFGAELQGSGGGFYSWSSATTLDDPLIAKPLAYPTVTTDYELIVTNLNGCVGIDSVTVTVVNDYEFTPANVITPNGDGANDVWNIINIANYPDNHVAIYNRYGQEIFNAFGYNNEWDATYQGKTVADGSYYYVLTFDGSEKVYKGAITVIGK